MKERTKKAVSLEGDSSHVTQKLGHGVLNFPESRHTAAFAFDMLAKSAQRSEPVPAGIHGTDIHPLLMAGAGEMLIQRRKGSICAMAQVAFVTCAIPSPGRSIKSASLPRVASRNHAGGIRDDVVPVILTDNAIYVIALYAGRAMP